MKNSFDFLIFLSHFLMICISLFCFRKSLWTEQDDEEEPRKKEEADNDCLCKCYRKCLTWSKNLCSFLSVYIESRDQKNRQYVVLWKRFLPKTYKCRRSYWLMTSFLLDVDDVWKSLAVSNAVKWLPFCKLTSRLQWTLTMY